MTAAVSFAFDNSYARLPERFFARLAPTRMPAPRLIRLNDALTRHLGLDPEQLSTPEGIDILAGRRLPVGAAPLAWPMPDISSASGSRSSGTGAPSCSAK